MTSTTNIHFQKDGQTHYVKHGFSWQLALFGPIAYFWRAQYLLALVSVPLLYIAYMLVGVVTILVLDLNEDFATLIGLVAVCGLHGAFGNRFSARSYVKNGWRPVSDFPEDWNRPPVLPAAATVGQQQ